MPEKRESMASSTAKRSFHIFHEWGRRVAVASSWPRWLLRQPKWSPPARLSHTQYTICWLCISSPVRWTDAQAESGALVSSSQSFKSPGNLYECVCESVCAAGDACRGIFSDCADQTISPRSCRLEAAWCNPGQSLQNMEIKDRFIQKSDNWSLKYNQEQVLKKNI